MNDQILRSKREGAFDQLKAEDPESAFKGMQSEWGNHCKIRVNNI
jgi:hypothetical protein